MDFRPLGVFKSVSYPVSRGTGDISSLLSWDHQQSWEVPTSEDFHMSNSGSSSSCVYEIDISEDSPDHYIIGHVIDGKVLYPATGYLVLVWRTLAKIKGLPIEKTRLILEDIYFHRATIILKEGKHEHRDKKV